MTWTLITLLLNAAPAPDAGTGIASALTTRPVHITADHFRLEDKKHQIFWRGHVKALRDDLNLSCDRMTVFYVGEMHNYTRLLCDGDVEVLEGNRWGRGEHADFDNVKGIIVFTGSPEARQGKDHIQGSKVTFFVGTDQLDVDHAQMVLDSNQKDASLPKAAPKHRVGDDGGTRTPPPSRAGQKGSPAP